MIYNLRNRTLALHGKRMSLPTQYLRRRSSKRTVALPRGSDNPL